MKPIATHLKATCFARALGLGIRILLVVAATFPTREASGAEAADPVPMSLVCIDDHPPQRPYYKMLGDVDGDGLLDILIGGASGPLVYYRHPTWTKTQIAAGGWQGVRGDVGDIDRDGDLDIVMCGIVWFSNPGRGQGDWTMQRVDDQDSHDVVLGDLNADGRLDIVSRGQSSFGRTGNAVHLYLQSEATWKKNTLQVPHGEGIALADLDRDNDLDIVLGGLWWENLGAAGDWTRRDYTTAYADADAKVAVADLNGDQRLDVVLAPAELRGDRYKVAWYEAPEDPQQADWTEHIIVPEIETVIHSLAAGDFDLDGDADLAIAEMHQGDDPDEVSLIINLGVGRKWHKQVLATSGSHDLIVGDIDADGDLDLVGANHAGAFSPVQLWRNGTRGSETTTGVWENAEVARTIQAAVDAVDARRMATHLDYLARDPLPYRKLNFTLPGHEKSTLHEADEYLGGILASAGYHVEREGVQVQAYRCDPDKPKHHQYSPPQAGDPWYTAYNLYGERKGSTRPEDIILLLAHKDSQSWVDSPGANDNAIGAVGVLEMAQVLADHVPQRTIRFLLCNEEHTPWTSVTAAEKSRQRGDRIIAVFNLDGIGVKSDEDTAAGKKTNVTVYTEMPGQQLAELMSAVNERFQLGLEQRAAKRPRPGDDDGSFVRAGFPAAVINIGSWPYADPQYHLEGDRPERTDVKNAAMTVQATLAAVLTLDNGR